MATIFNNNIAQVKGVVNSDLSRDRKYDYWYIIIQKLDPIYSNTIELSRKFRVHGKIISCRAKFIQRYFLICQFFIFKYIQNYWVIDWLERIP